MKKLGSHLISSSFKLVLKLASNTQQTNRRHTRKVVGAEGSQIGDFVFVLDNVHSDRQRALRAILSRMHCILLL